jgi:hypothetical protein
MRQRLIVSLTMTGWVLGHALATVGIAASDAGRPQGLQTPSEVTQAIESAKASRAAGRATEAAEALAAVLKKYPGSADAAKLQIETLLELDRFPDALSTYDAYVAALGKPDPGALGQLARADLVRTVRLRSDQPILRAQALERLARHGDTAALSALREQAWSISMITPESLAPTIALARLKDPAGEARLREMVGASLPTARAQAIQAIGDGDVRALAPAIIPLLTDPDVNVRSAAATTLGALQAKSAIPQLKSAYENDVPAVKMFAAVSLRRLGDRTADEFLESLLNGQIAELRVIAAGAYEGSTTRSASWEKAVRALLAGPNELHRVRGAELLACCDPGAARSLLTSALASGNPLLRAAAARSLERRPDLGDAAIARRMLGDSAPTVRIHGAGLALGLR